MSAESLGNIGAETVIQDLKRRKIVRSSEAARHTIRLFRKLIKAHAKNPDVLISKVKELGKKLTAAQPTQLVLGNLTLRFLHIIREEKEKADKNEMVSPGHVSSKLYHFMGDSKQEGSFREGEDISMDLVGGIDDLESDIENSTDNIAEQAIEHIHANEIIMTFGKSSAVENFLLAAAKLRKFEVFVAESAPSFQGQELAKSLSKAGIQTTLIPDSAIYTMMARVNKVILGATAIFANGGILALSGSHMVASAANVHSVPVLVCSALYKLSPLFPHDQDTFNDLLSPNEVLEFEEAGEVQNARVLNPRFDYVPPSFVDLLVTNDGGHSPSYVYRLLAEFYSTEDVHDIMAGAR